MKMLVGEPVPAICGRGLTLQAQVAASRRERRYGCGASSRPGRRPTSSAQIIWRACATFWRRPSVPRSDLTACCGSKPHLKHQMPPLDFIATAAATILQNDVAAMRKRVDARTALLDIAAALASAGRPDALTIQDRLRAALISQQGVWSLTTAAVRSGHRSCRPE